MSDQEYRIWKYINSKTPFELSVPVTQNKYNSDIQNINNNIEKNLLNTTNSISNIEKKFTNIEDNLKQTQDLLFSDSNVLFEESFKSINNIQLCASIVIRIKQLIENNNHDYVLNKYYNYAKIIRPEIDMLFSAVPNLTTSIFINSTYSNKKTFLFNNMSYNKYSKYDLNIYDNHDISLIVNFNKTTISLLNNKSNIELENYLLKKPNATEFYSIISLPKSDINQIPQLAYLYFKLDTTYNIWTVCVAITDLLYNSIINDNNNNYNNLITNINNLLNNWNEINTKDDNITTIIEYKSALEFDNTKCLDSLTYPEWINDYLPNLHKGNSDYNVVSEYKNTINQLWYNYPMLQENDIVILSGFMGEEYYCNVVKIIKYLDQKENKLVLSFIQQKIDIRPFFPGVEIKNDIIINGILKVQNSEGINIIQTDNIKNITSFQDKIGINQEIYNIKGLLDIDNLSSKVISDILTEFKSSLLNSYFITEQLKNDIKHNGISNNDIFLNIISQYNFAIFHTYIFKSIENNNIFFDHVEANTSSIFKDFSDKRLSISSFSKIKQIVTELYTMLYLENLSISEDNILSFIEILSDSTGIFLCSLRSIVRYNEEDSSYKVYFIVTYLPIEKYYNNSSYVKELDLLINSFSQANRFINYSYLILEDLKIQQNLINGKTHDETNNTFTGFIDNSKYFKDRFGNSSLYCFIINFPNDQKLVPLHEKYRFWENKPGITNFIPNSDVSIDSIIDIIYNNYKFNYGSNKYKYSFPVTYDFISGPKISFVQMYELNGQNYYLGSGVDIGNIISESIILKGDNKISGNLSIVDDITNNNIFNIDTNKKECYSMYNTGIGTIKPESKLDINDCGIYDVINIINELSKKFNIINFNLSNVNPNFISLKKFITSTDIDKGIENITNYFNDYLVNPIIDGTQNNNKIIQTKDNYFTLHKLDYDNYGNIIVNNINIIYNYLYPEWNGRVLSDIIENEKQNKIAANYLLQTVLNTTIKNIYFDGSYRIIYYPWVNGIKINIGYVFSIENKLYLLQTGIDIQNNLNIETNTNIVRFLETIIAHSNRLQDMVYKIKNPNIVLNKNISEFNRQNQQINYSSGKLFKYIIDMNNKTNTQIQELNINDYTEEIGELKTFNNLNNSTEELELKNKLTLFGFKLSEYFSAYWNNTIKYTLQPYFTAGSYGIIHCEDDYYDYCSTFWMESISGPQNNLLTFYSFETKLVDVINSTIQNKGDFTLKGDLYLHDRSTDKTFMLLDSNNRFLGFNTTQVYGNYSNDYVTTSSVPLAKHNCYIKSDLYPNTVIERNCERDPSIVEPSYKADGETDYYFFKNFSTSTSRRQSNYFTFNEMAENSKLCRNNINTGKPNAFGYNKKNVYCYGADKNFEVKDKTGLIKEMGCLSIGIESITNNTDINSAFLVNVIDKIPNNSNVMERNIMYCSNDSNLYVNNVTTNGIRFGGHPDSPVSNNNNFLWVDTDLSGNPRLRFGDKVVNLSNV
jgi:hypothetical protein